MASNDMYLILRHVRIGTTSPNYPLQVYRAGNSYISLDTNSGGSTNLLLNSDTYSSVVAATKLGISTSGAERVRIESNGNVGIGSAVPAATLDVVGDIKMSGDLIQTVPMISSYSTTGCLAWTSTTFTGVTNVIALSDQFSQGISRSNSTLTFAKGGTYMVSFSANGFATSRYVAFRLRRTNGTPGTLIQRTSFSGVNGSPDQFGGGLYGLFRVNAGDTIDLQYAAKGTADNNWCASNPIDTENMVTAQLDIWRVQ